MENPEKLPVRQFVERTASMCDGKILKYKRPDKSYFNNTHTHIRLLMRFRVRIVAGSAFLSTVKSKYV